MAKRQADNSDGAGAFGSSLSTGQLYPALALLMIQPCESTDYLFSQVKIEIFASCRQSLLTKYINEILFVYLAESILEEKACWTYNNRKNFEFYEVWSSSF